MNTLPELQSEIKEAENLTALWAEIIFYFDEAYEVPVKLRARAEMFGSVESSHFVLRHLSLWDVSTARRC